MSEGTFENDAREGEGQESEAQESKELATGRGPTESGSEPKKNQGDPMDDVNLEPPSS
ncbi:MAG TPA: hypothetical protein VM093_09925 [Aeromicrobium sp.]|nr:hypothetical protein [Aeromicrobium sp.]